MRGAHDEAVRQGGALSRRDELGESPALERSETKALSIIFRKDEANGPVAKPATTVVEELVR